VHDASSGIEIASTTEVPGGRLRPAADVLYAIDDGRLFGLAPDTLAKTWEIDVSPATDFVALFDAGLVLTDDERTIVAYADAPGA
jgi:hypothetical protein